MSIQKAYNEWSETYDTDQNLTRDLDEKVTRETLANLRFDSILEIGCGTGKNTTFLAQVGAHVHALDFSEGMIEKAREKVKEENVKFSVADLTQKWPCENRSYDLIVCTSFWNTSQIFPSFFQRPFEFWRSREDSWSMSFIRFDIMTTTTPTTAVLAGW